MAHVHRFSVTFRGLEPASSAPWQYLVNSFNASGATWCAHLTRVVPIAHGLGYSLAPANHVRLALLAAWVDPLLAAGHR